MSLAESEEDLRAYRVVVNDDEQYSIWPQRRDLPEGWHLTGHGGTRQECLDWITEVWTDLRPRHLR